MYETYTTKAIVCGVQSRNTADASCRLFTREAGMLFASVRGARKERSRQRYATQEFSLVQVSLVKGKAGWRVGSVVPLKNLYHDALDRAARGSVVSVVRQLRRFVRGEAVDPQLFDRIEQALLVLGRSMEHRTFVELVVVVQLLSTLGYVDTAAIPPALREAEPAQLDELYTPEGMAAIEQIYTHAEQVSHL